MKLDMKNLFILLLMLLLAVQSLRLQTLTRRLDRLSETINMLANSTEMNSNSISQLAEVSGKHARMMEAICNELSALRSSR